MICSEFAGCNEAMRGVLKYNPFSLVGFIEVMDQAMTLTSGEKEAFMI
jgi:trehalose-6-phosphate synthase